ncbi:hypothetical protein ACFQ6E_38570 [Streptomyces sp. NPDC056462]|uniref:hypothetical protein n=1 Tax=Streptomyces sp. NPDC056462 TaxID=3345826 RepID=UPI0036B53EC2
MHFSDGGIGRYDVVVGADGIWSSLRESVDPGCRPRQLAQTPRRDRTRSMPTTLRDLP